MSIWFFGDPHEEFGPLLAAAADGRIRGEDTVVLLGDYEVYEPLRRVLAPVTATGATVRWIMGNHDVGDSVTYDCVTSWTDAALGSRVHVSADGTRVAGLDGVFKGSIWYPPDAPKFQSRTGYVASLRCCQRWRGGVPLRHRDAIFPEDVEVLGQLRVDVLVTHEAPTTHRHGYRVIDDLAVQLGARLIVHGHHHRSYDGELPGGVRVRGLGIAELWRLPEQEPVT